MKLFTLIQKCIARSCALSMRVSIVLLSLLMPLSAFAANTPSDAMTFEQLATNISNTGNDIMKLLMVVVTIGGVMLVLKGLMHLKNHHTAGGGGQEKHMTKGLASLVFGAALFIVIPITHALVGGLAGTNTKLNQWSVSNYYAGSLNSTSTNSTPINNG